MSECIARRAGSIVEVLGHRAHHQTDCLAYEFLNGDDAPPERMSFGVLDRRARALAAEIEQRARQGERAIIVLQPGFNYIVALFACFYARVVAVPTFPPRARRLRDTLVAIGRDCEAAVILTDLKSQAGVVGHLQDEMNLEKLSILLVDDEIAATASGWDGQLPDPRELALLQYTSGSTGQPKGVMITHGNLISNLEAAVRRFDIGQRSRGVSWLPPYHDMGLVAGTLQSPYSQCAITVMSPMYAMQRPVRWLKAIQNLRATVSGAPPFGYAACSAIDKAQLDELDLSSWDCAFVGAEPVQHAALERFAQTFARSGFRRSAFAPCYGLAEATLMVTGRSKGSGARKHSGTDADVTDRSTCGHAVDGHEVVIVDPDRRTRCADGSKGEIWVRGPSVAVGYWNRKVETAATFDGRLANGDGPFLRTGDLGVITAGELAVTGRIKDLVIVAGRKLHAEDIEATILGVRDARLRDNAIAVFGAEVDGKERIVVAIELRRSPERLTHEAVEIRKVVGTAVTRDHDVAVYDVMFLAPGEMPRTSSGKIRRHQCRKQYLEQRTLLQHETT